MAAVTFPLRDTEERVIGACRAGSSGPTGTPRAIYLHFHGGGMISGSAALMDIPNQMTRERASASRSCRSSTARRRSSRGRPVPTTALAVARALLDGVGAELGSERLLIGGESAGGYMAAAVALRVRDELRRDRPGRRPEPHLRRARLERNASHVGRRGTDGFDVLSPDFMRLSATSATCPADTDDERRAPEISPAYADLRGLPPCFVASAPATICSTTRCCSRPAPRPRA